MTYQGSRKLLMLIAGAALVWMLMLVNMGDPGRVGSEAAVLQGVSAEAQAGTTAGRQALVGSAWWGPLPLLAHLAITTIVRNPAPFDVPLAAWLSALCVVAGCLWLLGTPHVVAGCEWKGRRPSVLPLVLIAVLPETLRLATGGSTEAILLPLALVVVVQGAAWLATGLLRHLVPTGFALAGLLLCGAAAWGWVLFGLLLLLLGGLRTLALARRLPGLLLLGSLPVVYTLGVWYLVNWLIMQRGSYFLQILGTLPAPVWTAPGVVLTSWTAQASAIICAGGVLLGIAARDGRRAGYGLAGLAAVGWLWTLDAFGLPWAGDATRVLLVASALLVVTRLLVVEGERHPVPALALQLVLLVVTVVLQPAANRMIRGLPVASGDPWSAGDAIADAVEGHVTALSPHARVFVCGYEGLGLLRGDRRNDLFVPVMDLHLGALRRDYWGQTLFVLVRKPEGRAVMESTHWREPDFYRLGSSRTLLSADFGDWRLYEVISAPLLRELQTSQ